VQNKHIDDDEYGTCRMTWALFLLLLLLLLVLFLLLALCTTALYPVVAESEQTHNLIHPFGAAAAESQCS
jgi:predicted membrane protein